MRGSRRRGLGEGGGPPSATRSTKRRRRRGREEALADLTARASDHPAHSCCSTRAVDTASRIRPPTELVVRRPAAAIERPHCSCRPRVGTGHLGGLLHGHERHGDVRPRSTTSRGSVGATPNARSSENIASSAVTTRRPRRALFGEVVLDNPTSVRDRWRCSQGAGSARWVPTAGEHAPMCPVRLHPSISPKEHGATHLASGLVRSYARIFSREPADGRRGGPTGALSPPTTHGMHPAPQPKRRRHF